MHCKSCHYSLENLAEHRCPECGRAFDPDDLDTYEFAELEEFKRRCRLFYWDTRRVIICAIVTFLLAFVITSVAPSTPQAQRWQWNLQGILNALIYVPLLVLVVWWGYEFVEDCLHKLSKRSKKQARRNGTGH